MKKKSELWDKKSQLCFIFFIQCDFMAVFPPIPLHLMFLNEESSHTYMHDAILFLIV